MFQFFKGQLSKIRGALSKTRQALTGKISSLFKGGWDESTFEELERILYEADLGSSAAIELVEETKLFVKKKRDASSKEILEFLHGKVMEILSVEPKTKSKEPLGGQPRVILVVGVNGSGKTTSIAKLAHQLKAEGQSVLLAAGDTFRAAAIDQLATWAERLEVPIVKSSPGGDPAAVAFDALQSAQARGVDTLIIDTAGRLQNKTDLMRELDKVVRVIQKLAPDAPHEVLLVLDATTGQNGVDQAEVFDTFTPLTGIILAKLDGSAKGGVVISIYQKLGIPVEWVGVGESIEDLMPFDPSAYTSALFSPGKGDKKP